MVAKILRPGHQNFDIKTKYLPQRPHSQFFELSKGEEVSVRHYMNLLQQCRLPHGWIGHPKPFYVADRVVYKILNAPALIDWFADEFNLRTVFLARHPAAQALSVLRNRWGFSAEAYFAEDRFLVRYFTSEQIETGRAILREGSDWEKSILNWVVEVFVPLYRSRNPGLRLFYEQLVLEPDVIVSALADYLDLGDKKAMLEVVDKPSGSSRMCTDSTLSLIRGDQRQQLVNKWQGTLEPDQLREAQDILDRFEIDAYSMYESVPSRKCLIER